MKYYYILLAFFLIFHFQLKAQITVNVTVDATKPGFKIKEDFLGLSMEQKTINTGLGCCGVNGQVLSFFDGKPGVGNGRLINLFHNLSAHSILRMGGGTVDKMRWIDSARSASDDSLNVFYQTDVAKLFSFLRQVGWTAIYSINLGTSYVNGVGNPTNAASEAAYVYNNYSDVLHSISIGNEPYGFVSQGFRSSYTPTNYMQEYLPYYDAIKAANPAIPISGGDLSQEPANKDWITQYVASLNNNSGNSRPLAALNIHGYALSNTQNTIYNNGWLIDRLMDYSMPGYNNSPFVVNLGFIKQSATDANVPLRYAETGSSASDSAKVSNKFITALWALDFCYSLAVNKISGANFHGGGGSPYSVMFWGGGNNNPATNPLAATYPVGAIYYGLLAFVDGAKNMSLLPVTPTSPTVYKSSPRASYYATISDDGKTAKVTIINKDTVNAISAVVTLPNMAVGSATFRTLNFTNSILDLAANTYYAGTQVASDGTFAPVTNNTLAISNGNSFTVPVAAMTATVVTVALPSNILPVNLLSFTGQMAVNKVMLKWITAAEINNAGFNIERSIDGINFSEIGFVPAANTSQSNYAFTDSSIQKSQIYYYRLKQIDIDGHFTFSPIIQITTNIGNDDFFAITPNPNNGNFIFSTNNLAFKSLKMYNSLGEEILIKTAINQPNHISINTSSHLAKGIYYLHALSSTGKLIKTMKVIIR